MSLQTSISPTQVNITTQSSTASQADLTITVTNGGGQDVVISAIQICVPYLLAPAATFDSIVPSVDDTNNWDFGASQFTDGAFDASAASGANVVIAAGASVNFTLGNVTLTHTIPTPANVKIDVNVTSVDPATTDQVTTPLPCTINVAKTTASILAFSTQPATIYPGESATINWKCSGIDYCILDPAGQDHLNSAGTLTVKPDSTTTYTLYAYTTGVILFAQLTITVRYAQILSFGGVTHQDNKLNYGDKMILAWSCNQYVGSLRLVSNDNSMVMPDLLKAAPGNALQKGRVEIGPFTQDTILTLQAFNKIDVNTPAQQNTIDITINPLVTTFDYSTKKLAEYAPAVLKQYGIGFTLSPDGTQVMMDDGNKISDRDIYEHDEVTLSWNIQNASAVDIQPPLPGGPSLANLKGTLVIHPDQNVTYTLKTTGLNNNKPVTIVKTIQLLINPVQAQIVFPERFRVPPPGQTGQSMPPLSYGGSGCFFFLSDTSNQALHRVTRQGQQNIPATTPNGFAYTFTTGTPQNPTLKIATASVGNDYGPLTVIVADDSKGILGLPKDSPVRLFDSIVYQVLLTGINGNNGKPVNYASYTFDPKTQTFSPVTPCPFAPIQWADPVKKQGTITILGYNFVNAIPPGAGQVIGYNTLYAVGYTDPGYGGRGMIIPSTAANTAVGMFRSIRVPKGLTARFMGRAGTYKDFSTDTPDMADFSGTIFGGYLKN